MAERTHELAIIARFKDLASKGMKKLGEALKRFAVPGLKQIKRLSAAIFGLKNTVRMARAMRSAFGKVGRAMKMVARDARIMAKRSLKAFNKMRRAVGRFNVVMNQSLALFSKMGRGLRALARAIAAPIKAAISFNLVWAQIGQVLKSTGAVAGVTQAAVLKLAQSMQQATIFSTQSVLSLEALLLTFTEIRASNRVFERTTKIMADMATVMGVGLKEAAIQVGKALNDPILGLTALTRVGVTFTKKQKLVIKSLAESGQVMEAQSVILDELEREFGGVAAVMRDTFGGAVTNLVNVWGDLLIAIGQFVAQNEGMRALIEQISGAIESWITSLNKLRESEVLQVRIAELFRRGLILMVRGIQGLVEGIAFAVDAVTLLVATIGQIPGVTLPATAAQRRLTAEIEHQENVLKSSGESWDDLLAAERAGEISASLAIASRRKFAEAMVRAQKELARLRKEHEAAGFAATDFAGDIQGLTGFIDALVERLDALSLTGSFKGAAKDTGEIADNTGETTKNLGTWGLMVRGAAISMDEFLTSAKDFVAIGKNMASIFISGAQESFGDFFRTLRDEGELAWSALAESLKLKLSDILIDFAAQQIVAGGVSLLTKIPGLGDPSIRGPEVVATEANTLAIINNTAALVGGSKVLGAVQQNLPETALETPEKSMLMTVLGNVGSVLSAIGSIFVTVGGTIIQAMIAVVKFLASSVASGVMSFFGFNRGGSVPGGVQRLAGGGSVFGSTGIDNILTALSAGEFVMRRPAVQRFGTRFMESINQGRLPDSVGGGANPIIINVPVNINTMDSKSFESRLAENPRLFTAIIQQAVERSPGMQNTIRKASRRGFA